MVTDKGINELVQAFHGLNSKNKGVTLLLVGTYEHELDSLKPKTLEMITNNQNIITTGWVDDVRPYYAIANALVFPSYREGFPNVVLQAGAMQLPSIVTNINGCNEIIKDFKTGMIIPVKDKKALQKAMEFMLNNKNEAFLMGIESRKYIQSHFERQIVWEALLEEYKKLS